ncbi:MAG TPA: N-acetyltransferase [Thermoanaerobaculia bacterium]|nr:N-acetyltransferase [Thermoanaerobaculia bacterium]HUM29829.1 N-acetyltransferase [Thermoanaerobaculia bacterium]HXK68104.1 N-acetyltransferase [Thermoanaerobaculia bacterium]
MHEEDDAPAIVQPLSLQDLPFLIHLDSLCFDHENAYSPEAMQHFLSREGSRGFKAIHRGIPIAFILWVRDHIITLDVHPKWRQRGLGTKLMSMALRYMASSGFNRCVLEVDQVNEKALLLYRKQGFSVEAQFVENGKPRFRMICPNIDVRFSGIMPEGSEVLPPQGSS